MNIKELVIGGEDFISASCPKEWVITRGEKSI